MNEKKQTAVEWLKNELFIKADLILNKDGNLELFQLIRKAKEMEKEQIENACDIGFKDGVLYASGEIWIYESSEQYYNENFKK
jgi:hypothetical protein